MADTRELLRRTARQTFGWTQLRPGLLEAMEPLAEGRDTLAVMSTGHGKSAIYLVVTRALETLTVVVSPLIALQHDQLEHVADLPDLTGAAINSTMSAADQDAAWAATAGPWWRR